MERHIQGTTARKVKMESEQRGAENTRKFLQRGQQDGDTKRGHYTPISSAMPRKARPCLAAAETRDAARPPCATPSPGNAACLLFAIPGPDDGRSLSHPPLAKQHVRQWLHLNPMKLHVHHTC